MHDSDALKIAATVATVLASLTALGVAAGPLLYHRFWKYPKLIVKVESGKPWTRSPMFNDDQTTSKFLRAEVINSGRGEARNVRAVVQDWYGRTDTTVNFKPTDLDPSALHWVSLPWGFRRHSGGKIERRNTAPSINLAPRLNDFIDLINFNWGERDKVHVLLLDVDRPRGFDLNASALEGEFVITVVVVADNATAVTRYVHYKTSRQEPHITGVTARSEPPPTMD